MRSLVLLFLFVAHTALAVEVRGPVIDANSIPVANARVTLFTPSLQVFFEARTDANGQFQFPVVANGAYRLGVAARHFQYFESEIIVGTVDVIRSVNLSAEIEQGRWSIVGNTSPELLDGTGSGTLLPTGEILFCHDTEDPVVFDPVSRLKWFPPTSGSGQGCHIPTLNVDGSLFLAGGSEDGYPQGLVIRTVKQYWRTTNFWSRLPDMNVARWYPSVVRLPNERLMVLGGEQNGAPSRTDACEIFDPVAKQWANVAPFDLPSELIPTVLLYSGDVFKTWRYPELYNVAGNAWRAAPRMLQGRAGATIGDHCDHEMVMLSDGRVMTIGIAPLATNAATRFVEFYDPTRNEWALGPNPRYLRNRPEAVVLPDGRVLAFGGQYSDYRTPPPLRNAGTIQNCTKLTDIYDPSLNTWRGLADMNRYTHYHNVTVLVPDGRVIATGGAGLTANNSFAGDDMSIEAFEPPYLFRGVRPAIRSVSSRDLQLGTDFNVGIGFTDNPTEVVLVSARASTHWVDGGPQRFLSLPFTRSGDTLSASVPNDAIRALAGWYILFVMVDDIPSNGEMVRIMPAANTPMIKPLVSISTVSSIAAEGGENAELRFAHTTSTDAPFRIDFNVSGNGPSDLNVASNYIIIPVGQRATSMRLAAKVDAAREGPRSVRIEVRPNTSYAVDPAASSALISVQDSDGTPPPERRLTLSADVNRFRLSYTGPSGRSLEILSSNDLETWAPFTKAETVNNAVEVTFEGGMPFEFFRAYEE